MSSRSWLTTNARVRHHQRLQRRTCPRRSHHSRFVAGEHIDAVCAKCFFQLRQLRRVRRTLDDDSIAILVHAFVTSCIDYCISLLAGAPRTMTDKLQRVMNADARIISNTRKFDHGLTQLRHDVLYWLDVADRITFRLCVYVFLCLHGMAPSYLSELCRSVSESEGRRHHAVIGSQSTRRTSLQSGNRI